MASIHEIIKVEAHESEVLCIEYSSPDAGKRHGACTSFITVQTWDFDEAMVSSCVSAGGMQFPQLLSDYAKLMQQSSIGLGLSCWGAD